MKTTQPVLRTQRLILRPFVLEDAPQVQRLAGEREIAATTLTIPHPYADGMAEEWISAHQEKFLEGEAAIFAIVLTTSNELLGAIGLGIWKEHARGEIGYWIGKSYWNKGYCTEAAREVLRFGFEELGLISIFACHFRGNESSGRVMQKLCMAKAGMLRQHILKWGIAEDLVFYDILRSEFQCNTG